jgi:Zn-dependent membrane protease YugP
MTGEQAARLILDRNGLGDVAVERVSGRLSDHYDPRRRVLRLSEGVYGEASIAAVSVAAHEAGHAIQHKERYGALVARNLFAPLASFSSKVSGLLLLGGLLLVYIRPSFWYWGPFLFDIGILLYAAVVLFQLITLPVEFNASRRALALLDSQRILYADESPGAQRMLSAAALTYVAAMAASLLTLIRLLLVRGRN